MYRNRPELQHSLLLKRTTVHHEFERQLGLPLQNQADRIAAQNDDF
jgi:hypothetical protein